jgi:hypothetical protein
MATAKKAAPKAAVTTNKSPAPVQAKKAVVKAPAKKAPVSKADKAIVEITANIAKLTERKNKLGAEINALRDQRAALKAAPVAAAPAAPKPKAKAAAKPAAKPSAPAKKTKAAAKK